MPSAIIKRCLQAMNSIRNFIILSREGGGVIMAKPMGRKRPKEYQENPAAPFPLPWAAQAGDGGGCVAGTDQQRGKISWAPTCCAR